MVPCRPHPPPSTPPAPSLLIGGGGGWGPRGSAAVPPPPPAINAARSIVADREAMKHCLLHHSAVAQVFDDDSLQQRWCDVGVPDALGIDHDDRPSGADAQARR